ncbi:MAG: sulfur carrier protein ThiS adenylyltransferase ThiF [Desulfovibrio desulfuricans]|nr:sulfur carrier protein ThiS adenylyltransferase ThiF [Desulfovibrio desulfuricans]
MKERASVTNPLCQGLGRYMAPEQLAILQQARIGIAGAGGLGSNAALMLTRSGVEHLTLVDDDVVDASNLNRQQYWPRHVGRCKVDALHEILLELNPRMMVDSRKMRITSASLPGLLPLCPIWVEALDNPEDKSLFVESALLAGHRVASASGMGGFGGAPMGRRRLGNLVLVGDFTTDILMAPPLAPRVTEAAALLADAVLEMLLGGPHMPETAL